MLTNNDNTISIEIRNDKKSNSLIEPTLDGQVPNKNLLETRRKTENSP
jgi:hypothetical protein